jgi:hypothetical protein
MKDCCLPTKKVLEALRNVTQSRGYTAAEEATAKAMLAKHDATVEEHCVPPSLPSKAPPLDPNNSLFRRWAQGFFENSRGYPATEEWSILNIKSPFKM